MSQAQRRIIAAINKLKAAENPMVTFSKDKLVMANEAFEIASKAMADARSILGAALELIEEEKIEVH